MGLRDGISKVSNFLSSQESEGWENPKSEVRAPHAWQMFVSRMVLDSRICRHTRTRLLSRIEQDRAFLLFFFSSCIHAGSTFSREGTGPRLLRSLGVCETLLCGRSPSLRDATMTFAVHGFAKLNRNFGRTFCAAERAIARPRLSCWGRNGRAEAQRTRVSARCTYRMH